MAAHVNYHKIIDQGATGGIRRLSHVSMFRVMPWQYGAPFPPYLEEFPDIHFNKNLNKFDTDSVSYGLLKASFEKKH
jgi:hypothetical protein